MSPLFVGIDICTQKNHLELVYRQSTKYLFFLFSGIQNPKCPQNTPWWYYNGYCYYFEKELRVPHARAQIRCSYYKDGNLVKIDSEKEKVLCFEL